MDLCQGSLRISDNTSFVFLLRASKQNRISRFTLECRLVTKEQERQFAGLTWGFILYKVQGL